MDATFKLPGRAPLLVKGWGNFQMELVAALAGVKPVIHCWVSEEDETYLQGLCKAIGFKHLIYTRDGGGSQRLGAMVGKNMKDLEACAAVWNRPASNPGVNLGYPECCSKFYCDSYGDPSSPIDCVQHSLNNTPGKGPLPFLLNDVFYMYSRKGHPDDNARRQKLYELNRGLPLDTLNVIGWHPCSYRCQESLKRAKKIFATLKKVWPEHARLLEAALRGRIYFWDWWKFAVVRDGRVQGPFAPVDQADVEALNAGRKPSGEFSVLEFA